jgi:hypothetical protein
MRALFLVNLVLVVGCIGNKGLGDEETGLDTSATGETGSTVVTHDTADCEPGNGDPGPVMVEGDANLSVSIAGYEFEATSGYWNAGECVSRFSASYFQSDVSYVIAVEVFGDLRGSGNFPIKLFTYSENPAQCEATVAYVAELPDASIEITGHSDNNHIFGSLVGTFSAVDTVSGSSAEISAIDLESWPIF